MYHDGHLLCQTLLQYTATRILLVFSYESVNRLLVQRGKNLDITLCVIVRDIEPELIEFIRSGTSRIKPNVTTLSLAKLLTVTLRDERAGQCKGLYVVAQRTANQLRTCGHIAPLVVTTQL